MNPAVPRIKVNTNINLEPCSKYRGSFTAIEIAASGFSPLNDKTGRSTDNHLYCVNCGLVIKNIPDGVSLVLLHLVCPHCPYIENLIRNLNSECESRSLVGEDNPSPIRLRDEMDIQKGDTLQEIYDKHNTLRYWTLSLPDIVRAQLLPSEPSKPSDSGSSTPENFLSLGISSNAETTQMARDEIRRKTLETFPNHQLLNLESLIQAGWYWTGIGGEMKTFCCAVACSDWNANTNPIVRHAQLSKSCTFLRSHYQPEYLARLLRDNEEYEPSQSKLLIEKVLMKHVKPILDSLPVASIRNNWKKFILLGGTRESLKKELLDCISERIKYGKGGYRTENEVIQDLHSLRSKRQQKTTPSPAHTLEGIEVYIDRSFTSEIMKKQQKEAREKRHVAHRQQGGAADMDTEEVTTSMRCLICLSELREILYVPCTHLVTCAGCSLTQSICPVCRRAIKGTVRVKLLAGSGTPQAKPQPTQTTEIDLINPNIPDINLREILENTRKSDPQKMNRNKILQSAGQNRLTTTSGSAEREENKMEAAASAAEGLPGLENIAMSPELVSNFGSSVNITQSVLLQEKKTSAIAQKTQNSMETDKQTDLVQKSTRKHSPTPEETRFAVDMV